MVFAIPECGKPPVYLPDSACAGVSHVELLERFVSLAGTLQVVLCFNPALAEDGHKLVVHGVVRKYLPNGTLSESTMFMDIPCSNEVSAYVDR